MGEGPAPCNYDFPGPICSDHKVGTCSDGCAVERITRRSDVGVDVDSDSEQVKAVMCQDYTLDAGDAGGTDVDASDTGEATDG